MFVRRIVSRASTRLTLRRRLSRVSRYSSKVDRWNFSRKRETANRCFLFLYELLTLPTEDDSNNYIYEIRSNIPCTSIRISKYQLITSIQRIFSLIYQ